MSNIEHLMENAISCMKEYEFNEGYGKFINAKHNTTMIAQLPGYNGHNFHELANIFWRAAYYVVYSHDIWTRADEREKMIRQYGYLPPEDNE